MESTRRLTIAIGLAAAQRLNDLAIAERRDPREEAAIVLERALVRLSREANRRRAPGEAPVPLPPPRTIPAERAPR